LSDEQITVRIASLLKEKENIEKEIEKIQNELLQKLCPKEKKECEPTYCIFRLTGSCRSLILKKWHKILKEANVRKDTKYDLFIDFIEKNIPVS